jgi:hypothetical protein
MFASDYKTHLGYMRSGAQVNNSHPNAYQSVAAFEPRDSQSLPRFRIFDLDTSGIHFQDILQDYTSVLQNLRLVKRPGLNQWSPQGRKWSEAALGEDEAGRFYLSIRVHPSRCTISTTNCWLLASAWSPPNI